MGYVDVLYKGEQIASFAAEQFPIQIGNYVRSIIQFAELLRENGGGYIRLDLKENNSVQVNARAFNSQIEPGKTARINIRKRNGQIRGDEAIIRVSNFQVRNNLPKIGR